MLHNLHAVMLANEVMERKMQLSKLQQEFYNLVIDFVENDPDTLASIEAEEDWDSYVKGLKKDIKTMNAAELRHNIKLWKES